MTDHEKRIREALEAGPTEGPFHVIQAESAAYSYDVMTEDGYYVATAHGLVRGEDNTGEVTAAFIAACNPAAIRALLAELDAMRGALEAFVNDIVPNDPQDPLWVRARAALSAAKDGGWVAVQNKPVAYRVDWPVEAGVGMRRFYGADEWDSARGTVEFFGGIPVPLAPLPNPPKGEV